MAIKRFEDIIAWQKAQSYAVNIYHLFGKNKDYGFKDQICRAAVSISNNIAEGFDRNSNADFLRFLYYSISSCSETKSMIYLAEKLGYISLSQQDELLQQANEISKILHGLMNSLKK